MGIHEDYGHDVIASAAGSAFQSKGIDAWVGLGEAGSAQIDGTVAGHIAVEIEARTSKQVRGAVLDLILHPYPQKLLVLVSANMDPARTADQCRHIMRRFLDTNSFAVVPLTGSGRNSSLAEDAARVAEALRELGFDRSL